MNQKTYEKLDELLHYLWFDEKKSWEEAGKPDKGHIFCVMMDLDDELIKYCMKGKDDA